MPRYEDRKAAALAQVACFRALRDRLTDLNLGCVIVTGGGSSTFDGEAARLTRKCIDLAMEGDPTALRLCLSRVLPVKWERAP